MTVYSILSIETLAFTLLNKAASLGPHILCMRIPLLDDYLLVEGKFVNLSSMTKQQTYEMWFTALSDALPDDFRAFRPPIQIYRYILIQKNGSFKGCQIKVRRAMLPIVTNNYYNRLMLCALFCFPVAIIMLIGLSEHKKARAVAQAALASAHIEIQKAMAAASATAGQ